MAGLGNNELNVFIEKVPGLSNVYKLVKKYFRYGIMISDEITEITIPTPFTPDPVDVVGVIETEYPDQYNIITSISELGSVVSLEVDEFLSGGMQFACADCTSLQSVVVKRDFNFMDWSNDCWDNFSKHDYAFYKCTSLVSVDFDDIFEKRAESNVPYWGTCKGMFQGCNNLTTINTSDNVIRLTHIYDQKDMFRGCTRLTGLRISYDDPSLDLKAPYDFEDIRTGVQVRYEHACEWLGLSPDQFIQVEA